MKRLKIVVLLSLFILGLTSCKNSSEQDKTKDNMSPRVRFIKLSKSQEKKYLEALGSLVYYTKADVGSKVEGRIEKIFVKEGMKVYKGRSLARVERLPFLLALQNAKTELLQAKNRKRISEINYKDAAKNVLKHLASIQKAWAEVLDKELYLKNSRIKLSNTEALYKAGGVTKSTYDQAVTSFSSANVALTVAKKNLDVLQIGYQDKDLHALGYKGNFSTKKRQELLIKINTAKERAALASAKNDVLKSMNNLRQARMLYKETIIRSPISGVVVMKSIERGEQVKKDTKLFTIMNISKMYANLSVSEDDVGRIIKKGRVKVFIDALNKKSIWGTITLVHPLVDPRTRSVTVKVLLNNYNRLIKPGMFARGRLNLIKNAQAWLIPAGAVLERKMNLGSVYILKNKSIFKLKVMTGKIKGDQIEILKGLEKNMLIAVPPKNENESELSVLSDGVNVIPVLPEGLKVSDKKQIRKKEKKVKKIKKRQKVKRIR